MVLLSYTAEWKKPFQAALKSEQFEVLDRPTLNGLAVEDQ